MNKSIEIENKLNRVRELVDLLENWGENGICLKLNLRRASLTEESKWEETSRDQYDVQKYYT